MRVYHLSTGRTAFVRNFMNALKNLVPDLSEIESSVFDALNVYADVLPTGPFWRSSGDFAAAYERGSLNHYMEYLPTDSQSIIQRIELLGYTNSTARIYLDILDNSHHAQICSLLTNANIPFRQWNNELQFSFENERSHNDEGIIQGIWSVLSNLQTHVDEIMREVIGHIGRVRNTPPVPQPRTSNGLRVHSFFSPSSAVSERPLIAEDPSLDAALQASFDQSTSTKPIALPSAGSNADALQAIGYAEPLNEKYVCMLSGDIMSEPVYDKAHPDIKFEKNWILRSLETKAENPFTRTALTSTDLIADIPLKQEIDAFVTNIVANHQPQTSPK